VRGAECRSGDCPLVGGRFIVELYMAAILPGGHPLIRPDTRGGRSALCSRGDLSR
jgi:hypothetical protein